MYERAVERMAASRWFHPMKSALRVGCGCVDLWSDSVGVQPTSRCGARHHDVRFRQILVKLVSRFMGRDMAKKLKQEFRNVGLKMSQTSTIKSPQKWLEDYYRMQRLREIHISGGAA